MKLRIHIAFDGQYTVGSTSIEVPEMQTACFAPLKTTSDYLSSLATGDLHSSSEVARRVIKTRRNAAEYLAGELAKEIEKIMRRRDTLNGYPVKKEE